MAVRRGRPTRSKTTNRGRSTATTRKSTGKTAVGKSTTPKRRGRPKSDVTEYATRQPTDYHKAMAKWTVQVIGYEPNDASSKRAAFLKGIQIATAARPVFAASEFLEEWREKTGNTKRGPKPKSVEPPADEFDEDEDEFEDSEDEFDDESDDDEDEDFEDDDEDDSDSDDDEFDEDEDDSDEDEDFEEEEEDPEPPKKTTRGRPPAKNTNSRARSAAPARSSRSKTGSKTTRARKTVDDDEDLF